MHKPNKSQRTPLMHKQFTEQDFNTTKITSMNIAHVIEDEQKNLKHVQHIHDTIKVAGLCFSKLLEQFLFKL